MRAQSIARSVQRLSLLLATVVGLAASLSVEAAAPAQASSVAAAVQALDRQEGFVPFYWDAAKGRVLLEIPAFNEDVLYYVSAASGGGVCGHGASGWRDARSATSSSTANSPWPPRTSPITG